MWVNSCHIKHVVDKGTLQYDCSKVTSNDGCENAIGNCGTKDRGNSTNVVDGGPHSGKKDTDDWYVVSNEHGDCSDVVGVLRVSHDKELQKAVIHSKESVVSCKEQNDDKGGSVGMKWCNRHENEEGNVVASMDKDSEGDKSIKTRENIESDFCAQLQR